MNKLHITFVLPSLKGAGAEIVCLTTMRSLLNRNYRIDLILHNYMGPKLLDIPEEVNLFVIDKRFHKKKKSQLCSISSEKIRWIKKPSFGEFFRARASYLQSLNCSRSFRLPSKSRHMYWVSSMAHYLTNERPDLVYANSLSAGTISILARRIAEVKIPVVWAIRNGPRYGIKPKDRVYYENLMPNADCIHAVSTGVAREVVELVPNVRDRITVIFNPVDPRLVSLAKYPVEHPWLQIKSESTSGTGPRVILAAGKLIKPKNFTMLARAFATIRSKRDVRLIILGEGKERTAIEKTIYDLNIEDSVSMPGWVHNPYAFMARADLFVLSSSYEGLPGVLIQALACGCPVVSTNCPHGPSEILENGRLGRLVPVDDPVSLAKAITATLDEEPNRAMLKNRANDFSSKHLIRQYEDMFNKVVAEAQS